LWLSFAANVKQEQVAPPRVGVDLTLPAGAKSEPEIWKSPDHDTHTIDHSSSSLFPSRLKRCKVSVRGSGSMIQSFLPHYRELVALGETDRGERYPVL
jgi:hypothetical protein